MEMMTRYLNILLYNEKDNVAEIWREDMDKFDEFENQLEQKKQNKVEKELSYDHALSM